MIRCFNETRKRGAVNGLKITANTQSDFVCVASDLLLLPLTNIKSFTLGTEKLCSCLRNACHCAWYSTRNPDL